MDQQDRGCRQRKSCRQRWGFEPVTQNCPCLKLWNNLYWKNQRRTVCTSCMWTCVVCFNNNTPPYHWRSAQQPGRTSALISYKTAS
uniref:Uncharacterized protein n=1 Tax=Picea glauca TaxID=3330 RepID=A0A117NIA3_PICGL|nr:hypothetical protein ABT39_MTgene2851 [Picea glauca]